MNTIHGGPMQGEGGHGIRGKNLVELGDFVAVE